MPYGDKITRRPEANPFFSIIMPTYNRAEFLSDSIDSIINQDYTDWELIVVDDGSGDHTKEAVNRYADERVKYYYKPNGGVSSARNLGIEKSKGLYICFLDDDDEYLANHLSYLNTEILTRNYPVTMLATHIFKRSRGDLAEQPFEEYNDNKSFCFLPWPQTACIHRKIFNRHRFNETLYIREDNELFDRIRNEFEIISLKKRTVIINRHEDNTTSNTIRYYKGLEDSVYFYIRNRKKIHLEEIADLSSVCYHLMYRYYANAQYLKMGGYLLKMFLIMPVALFDKEIRKPYRKVVTKFVNRFFLRQHAEIKK